MGAKTGQPQRKTSSYWDGDYDDDLWERDMAYTGCLDIEHEKTTPEGVASSQTQDDELDYQLISEVLSAGT